MKRLLVAILVVAIAAIVRTAEAHETRAAEIAIDATSRTTANVIVRSPPRATLVLDAPFGCTFDHDGGPARVLRCPGGLAGSEISVSGIGHYVDVVVVRMSGFGEREVEMAIVTARSPRIALPGAGGVPDVARRYVVLGIEHVLSGLDHVLFLLALFWQAWAAARASLRRAAWELAGTATAFTIAHSVTLAATVLGILHVPSALAEAIIAASLVLVALDVDRDAREQRRGARVALAGAFGLVHGLGFASALVEMHPSRDALALGLVSFNVGVEVAQLAVFACVSLVVVLLSRLVPKRPILPWTARASAYVVGGVGAAMFFLRALSMVHP